MIIHQVEIGRHLVIFDAVDASPQGIGTLQVQVDPFQAVAVEDQVREGEGIDADTVYKKISDLIKDK